MSDHLGHVVSAPSSRCALCGGHTTRGPLEIDLAAGTVSWEGHCAEKMRRRELLLLYALNDAAPRGLSRDVVRRCVWAEDEFHLASDDSLNTYVSIARKRLREAGIPYSIQASRGLGLTLVRM